MRPRPRKGLSRHWRCFTLLLNGHTVRLYQKKWWGYSAWSITRDGITSMLWGDEGSLREVLTMKKRKQNAEQSTAAHLAPMESVVFGKLHSIVAHCAATKYDDGDSRKPGWVTIKTNGSVWVIEAKDPDTSSKLTAIQPTLDDALALLGLLLEADEAPWEHDQWLAQAAAKAKKK